MQPGYAMLALVATWRRAGGWGLADESHTLVEAFACRLPIIASRLGPLAELVEDGKTGLLFDPGSAEDLSNKLRFAEARPQIMREMGENARAEYELKYTPRQNYQQLMGIYAEAISTNKMQLSLSYGTG